MILDEVLFWTVFCPSSIYKYLVMEKYGIFYISRAR